MERTFRNPLTSLCVQKNQFLAAVAKFNFFNAKKKH